MVQRCAGCSAIVLLDRYILVPAVPRVLTHTVLEPRDALTPVK
jgi:hypothetical protein